MLHNLAIDLMIICIVLKCETFFLLDNFHKCVQKFNNEVSIPYSKWYVDFKLNRTVLFVNVSLLKSEQRQSVIETNQALDIA